MRNLNYYSTQRCYSYIAADLMCCSERTGLRYLEKYLDVVNQPTSFVSVGSFCEFYKLHVKLLDMET